VPVKGINVAVSGVGSRDASLLRAVVEALDSKVRAAAHDSGVAQYVAPFSGHDVCSNAPWLFDMSAGFPSALHPNAAGQKAMASELGAAAGPPPQ
jgi:hypothetical protein